jgi:hypothetical protein
MADNKRPTERTRKGFEVPIPKRREFFSNLKKLARTTPQWKDMADEEGKRSATRRPKK